jgi:hypothetical protein
MWSITRMIFGEEAYNGNQNRPGWIKGIDLAVNAPESGSDASPGLHEHGKRLRNGLKT